MEGLIPLVLKSMKRSKTLRQYQSLSGVHSDHQKNSLIDIDDFYHPEEGYIDYHYQYSAPTGPQENARGFVRSIETGNGRHSRSKSFNYDHSNVFKPEQQKQLVRFRSHKWLSCVSGA